MRSPCSKAQGCVGMFVLLVVVWAKSALCMTAALLVHVCSLAEQSCSSKFF